MPKSETSLNELLYDIRRIVEHREKLTIRKIEAIYHSLEKDLNAFIANVYVTYADEEGRLYISYLDAKNRRARFLQEIVENVDSISVPLKNQIMSLVEETYTKSYEGMLKAFEKAYSETEFEYVSKDIAVNPNVLKQALNNNISKLTLPAVMEIHRNEIIYQIQQELNIGLMQGDRYERMAKRISERVGVSRSKAMNIVRTETHRNVESGFMDCAERLQKGLDGSDLIYAATWRTMKDERVRPQIRRKTKKDWKTSFSKSGANHMKMEGVTVKAGELFDLGNGVKAKAPSKSGMAAHDCNCRCFLEYNLMTAEEFAKATRKSAAAGLTSSGESGKIKLGSDDVALENQRYGRNKDTLVNKTYLESGEYKRKFDNATQNSDLNKALYKKAKEALIHRSGTVLEDMYWFDSDTGCVIAKEIDGIQERRIVYSSKTKNAVNAYEKNKLITLHTHPSSMPPSAGDFNACFRHGYKCGFIACHNGKVFGYTASEELNERLYNMYIESYVKSNHSEYDAQILALNELKRNCKIDFWEVQ